jgi:hypothetical protein
VFWQLALVFGLIALLGLVLRWTFSRESGLPHGRPRRPFGWFGRRDAAGTMPTASPISPAAAPRTGSSTSTGTSTAGAAANRNSEDYGLLAVAADVATAEEAAAIRRLLTEAGIRNTSTISGGRHKVLVFGHELMRARRVAGGAQGGTGGAQGAGNS